MGDMGEYYNDVRKANQERRAENRDKSREFLVENGIRFEAKNGGAHIIIKRDNHRFDFWPGTGLWKQQDGPRGRGVKKLIERLQQLPEQAKPT